jgi:nitrite reductase/ring-hydroxylating ferredoxin subunit
MDRQALVNILKELRAHASRGTTTMTEGPAEVDADRYRDPVRHERELEVMFRRHPQVVGMSCDLSAGEHDTQTVAGVPLLLSRGDDGTLRAFLNACRHRGTTVVQGCGSGKRFTCPWHAWSYDQRGSLVGVPHASTFGDLDRERLGLVEVPAFDRHGLMFVIPTRGVEADLDDMLGDLGPELGSFGFDNLHRVGVDTSELRCNWKLANETGFELYHVAYLHRDSVGPMNIGNTGAVTRYGYNHRMVAVSPSARQLDDVPEDDWDPFQHLQLIYNVFPTCGLVVSASLVALTRLDPGTTPDRTHFRYSTYSWNPLDSDDASTLARLAHDGLLHVVSNEDYPTVALTQANIDAGSIEKMLIGRNEPAVRWAHESYDTCLAVAGAS